MKRHWIEYRDQPPTGPMTFWVHRAVDLPVDAPWREATQHDPPRPGPVPGRGYPLYFVEFDGFTFEFASLHEMDHCIDVLGRKLMPRTIDLSRERGTAKGPNSHWLSRLPAEVKPWRYRERAVAYLEKARAEFARDAG